MKKLSLCLNLAIGMIKMEQTIPLVSADPILVELFTSQGCSSCPSADEVISNWGKFKFAQGEIVPLCFHVDYWNYIGWQDPFSASEFTDRQRNYAASLKSRSIYTPQMVVAGKTGFVGSNKTLAMQTVNHMKTETSPATIKLEYLWKESMLNLMIFINQHSASADLEGQDVLLAFFENGLVTQIPRGENAGLTLQNDFVVRKFLKAGKFDSSSEKTFHKTIEFPWNLKWNKEKSGAVVFLQNSKTMEISSVQSLFPLVP